MLKGFETPFDILLHYALRSRACALPPEDIKPPQEFWSGVGFTLGKESFVIPMEDLAEIINAPKFTKIPRLKHYVRGVANIRGSIVPVVDLMLFFNKNSSRIARLRRLFVLEYKDSFTGLLVDDISGMQHFPANNYQNTMPKSIDPKIAPFISGSYWRMKPRSNVKEVFSVLNTSSLLENEQFENLAI